MTAAATHRVARAGGVATVTLDRPEALNAQTRASRRALVRDLRTLSGDAAVRCVVLTGEGRAFCAGQDLREEGALANVDETIRESYVPIIEALVQMPKPVIAAVNGAAAGAGLSFALACDIRYLAEDAVLMMAFSNIALVPDSGGSWLLPRIVGYARAFELAATGRRVRSEAMSPRTMTASTGPFTSAASSRERFRISERSPATCRPGVSCSRSATASGARSSGTTTGPFRS